jgi:hypothetical protein
MSDAERDAASEQLNIPTRSEWFDRDFESESHERKLRLLGQLAEQAAGLRASAMVLGDRIERLGSLAAQRRVG